MFGDTRLSGIVKQEVSPLGELEYVGVMYFYGSKLPVHIRIKPSGHTQNGKLLYYIYNYLPVAEYKVCTPMQKKIQRRVFWSRHVAEVKVATILNKLGIIYEKQKERNKYKCEVKRSRRSRKKIH